MVGSVVDVRCGAVDSRNPVRADPMDNMMDETVWALAGRLAMLVHVLDYQEGYITASRLWHDHKLLTGYGYDTSGCICGLENPAIEPYPHVLNVAYMATQGA